jgi:hypothetical protein
MSEPPRRPRSNRRGVLASQGLTSIGVPDARQLLVSLPSATTFVLSAHASRTYVSGQVVAGMATETDPDEPAGGLGPDFLDSVQIVQKNWNSVGIEVDLKLKETGAFLASALYGRLLPGQPLNAADGERECADDLAEEVQARVGIQPAIEA